MPRLDTTVPPNTALQRTRSAPLRSPLSRKTFGVRSLFRAIARCLLALAAVPSLGAGQAGQQSGEHVELSDSEIIRLAVPEYEAKRGESERKLGNRADPMAWWYTYNATVVSKSRTDLGVKGRSFCVVAVVEADTPCNRCKFTTVAIIDLRNQKLVARCRLEGSLVDPEDLEISASSSKTLGAVRFRTLVVSHPDFIIEGVLKPSLERSNDQPFVCDHRAITTSP